MFRRERSRLVAQAILLTALAFCLGMATMQVVRHARSAPPVDGRP